MTYTILERLNHDLENDRATLDRVGITRWLMCVSSNKLLELEHPRLGKIYHQGSFSGSPEVIFDQFVKFSIEDLMEKHARALETALCDVDTPDLDRVADRAAGMLHSVRAQLFDRAAMIKGRLKGNGHNPKRDPIQILPHEQSDVFRRLRSRTSVIKRERCQKMSISAPTVGRLRSHIQSVQGVGYQSFTRQLRRLSEFLRDSELGAVCASLTHDIDAKAWVAKARSDAEGGDAELIWPGGRSADLGHSIALVHYLATLSGDEITDFASDFYYVSTRYDDNLARLSDELLAPLFADLTDYLLDKGLLDVETKSAGAQNVVNLLNSTGVAIQQGTLSSTQNAHLEINQSDALAAVNELGEALAALALPTDTKTNVDAEIATLRAQLSKTTPNSLLIGEVGKSLRSIVEGIAAGLLTPQVITAATATWVALGIV